MFLNCGMIFEVSYGTTNPQSGWHVCMTEVHILLVFTQTITKMKIFLVFLSKIYTCFIEITEVCQRNQNGLRLNR